MTRARRARRRRGRFRFGRFRELGGEFAKFGTVGAGAYVIDVGGSNLLWALLGDGNGHLTGKAVAAVAATTFAYAGNRYWTFRRRRRTTPVREYLLFVALNAIAQGIPLLCLGISVYLLGLDGLLAKNIAANVIGIGLGTAFRFWSYRRWVFPALVPPAPLADPVVVGRSL